MSHENGFQYNKLFTNKAPFSCFFFQINKSYEPVKASTYDENMKEWLQFYQLESFFMIENKDLSENPCKILKEVEIFLGIKHYFCKKTISGKRANTGSDYSFMSNTTRDILINYFRPHSLNFFSLVNRTFPWTLYP